MSKVYDLAEVIKQELDKKVAFTFKVDGGATFTIPSPALWSSEAHKVAGDTAKDDDDLVVLLIGKKRHQELCASTITIDGQTYPCSATLLLRALQHELGASLPESKASTGS